MIVRQAANVLDLLEYFAQVKKPSNLAEISLALDWPRSSTFNLLTTLAQRGFLYEPKPRGGYYPTPRWSALLQEISAAGLLPESLCLTVDEIAESTGETVAIAAPSGTSAVFLHVVESASAVRFAAQVGHQVPLHATASGRALLEQFTTSELQVVLRKSSFEKYTRQSLTTAAQVETEIRRAITRGWHENVEGHASDLIGIALPVRLDERRLSILVGGPSSRMQRRIAQIAATMKRAIKRHGA